MSDNETTVQLSERELEVLEMVATGASNQQIARQLVISINTVKVHLRNIFEKLGVQSRTEATLRAIQEGWVVVAEDNPETAEATGTASKVFFVTQPQLVLAKWQQIYLLLATFMTLTVIITPLVPKEIARETPKLPVIYAQPPTPIPPISTDNTNRWVTQAPMPTSRAGLGLVAFKERIFAIGGIKDNIGATSQVEIYNPLTNGWTEGTDKPTAAVDITAVVLHDKIYVPGGCTDDGQPITALEIYNPQTKRWEEGPALPEGRCAYGLVAWQDKLYLFGGWDGQTFTDTIFVFSAKENNWEVMDGVMPQAIGYLGTTVFNDTIYLAGGYDGTSEFNQTYAFTPATGEWLEKAPLQEKRGGLGLISTTKYLYAIGGGWDKALTTSERYDPAANSWTTFEAPFTNQWRNFGLTAIDTKIYAVGGWNGTDQEYMGSVVSYQFLYQVFLPVSASEQ